jgi:formate hydrogenlyase subunit 6/NADH:ubiquinone oxidoreductase subunit I
MQSRVRPEAPFRIACDQAEGQADSVVPCLGRLTEAILLELVGCGAERVELFAPDCSACRFQTAAAQWQKVLGVSRALCESAGLGADRVVRGEQARRKPANKQDLPDSRRAMFRALTKWTTDAAAPDAPKNGSGEAAPEVFRDVVRRHHENPKRAHLLDVLRALPGAEVTSTVLAADEAPFARLEVTPKCVGCNVCETLCPVGAISHSETSGTYTLDFDPASCTGCGVCVAACFFDAIRMRETVDLAVLFEPRRVNLVHAARQFCRGCNEGFLVESSDLATPSELCPLCLVSGQRRGEIARQMVLRGIHSA